MSIREPAVAGMFYPARAADLQEQIEYCFQGPGGPGSLPQVNPQGPHNIVGLVSPHAGYIYSGSVAAWAYYRLAEDGLPDIAVIIGPNHRSYAPAAALSDERAWHTPFGDVELDGEITAIIADACSSARIEPAAHTAEHSIEVQLPFLQYLTNQVNAKIRIVPISIGAIALPDAVAFAEELGNAVSQRLQGKKVVVIASTDFSHYESAEIARRKDSMAIFDILTLDEERLICTVESQNISMCGALPTAVAISACKKLGAINARKLAYSNSGDVTGDYSEVVGYAAIEIDR